MKHKQASPIGYVILVVAMIASAAIPSLTVIDHKSFIGIANSSIPEGTPKQYFGSLPREPLFQSIIKNGGQITIHNDLKHNLVGEAAGIWDPGEGAIKLLVGDFAYQDYLETLKHEGIHMAQSCSNYGLKSPALPLGLDVTEEGMRDLAQFRDSDPEYYLDPIEREAHSHDSKSQAFVIDLIDKHCASKPWIKASGQLKSKIQTWFLPQSLKRDTN